MRILLTVGEPRSPAELADEIGAALSDVAYHVRVLESHKAIRLVGEEPVNGSAKHYYAPGELADRNRDLIERILAASG